VGHGEGVRYDRGCSRFVAAPSGRTPPALPPPTCHDGTCVHDDDPNAPGDATRDLPPDTTPLFGGRSASAGATTTRPRDLGPDDQPADVEGPVMHDDASTRPQAATTGTDPDATTVVETVPTTDAGPTVVGDRAASGVPPTDDVVIDHDPDEQPRWGWRLAAVPVVVLLVAAAWVGWLFAERAGEAMPGVTVEGFDASGMTGDEISSRLDDIVATRRDATVTVTAGDAVYDYQLGEQGYDADVAATVDRALSSGRDGPFGSVVTHVEASRGQTAWNIDLAGISVDRDVDDFLARIDEEIDVPATAGSVTIDAENLAVDSEVPQPGADAKVDTVRAELVRLLGTGQDGDLAIPVETLPPLVEPANVQAAVERATAVLADSYVLVTGNDSLTIDPSEVAPSLSIVETDDGYDVALDRHGIRHVLADGRGDRFAVSPKSASYTVVNGYRTFDEKGSATFDPSPARVDVVEGRTGRAFNPDVATDLLVSLFDAGEHRGEFDLDVVAPSFSNEEARDARPDALLGTFTTYHEAGGNRVFNIHLLADLIAGEVLPPGDDFSVNRDIGDRNEEKGFRPAGAIKEGEIIDDDVGGGVSQLATTFYNAAFFAGIDVLSWKPHSLPIDRYPLAREATFSYSGGLDIHILNDTPGALVVETSYTSTSITVSIFGQDDGREVTARMGEPYDYEDFEVIRRTSDETPSGQTRTVQTGGEGFTVDYERIIRGGNSAGREEFSWAYSPKPTIIETGSG